MSEFGVPAPLDPFEAACQQDTTLAVLLTQQQNVRDMIETYHETNEAPPPEVATENYETAAAIAVRRRSLKMALDAANGRLDGFNASLAFIDAELVPEGLEGKEASKAFADNTARLMAYDELHAKAAGNEEHLLFLTGERAALISFGQNPADNGLAAYCSSQIGARRAYERIVIGLSDDGS